MHPRNVYKEKKPNFQALAVKYPEFQCHTSQEISGKVTLNFKDPDALRALSTVLLKEDFGLDVHIPADRLVPTIPLRLNYIHWIEDMLKTTWNDEIKGIDVGTGASCIYPLLGSRMNGWKFLASEQDEQSVASATKNVEQNGLQHLITIQKVEMDSGLKELLDGNGGSYDFCMCNPPFFGSQEEVDGQFQREGRSKPHSTSTASSMESITWGGEFCFVNRLIKDSLQLRDTVRVYTSMVGKKLNLAALKDELRNYKVPKISSTEFCQGKTMRWGLAWSFDPNFSFPKSHFKEKKKKSKPPLALCIPMEVAIEFKTFCIYIIELLEELKINFVEMKQNNWILILVLIVTENTWSHQRRKRRQMLREKAQSSVSSQSQDPVASTKEADLESQETSSDNPISESSQSVSANLAEMPVSESSLTGSANREEMSGLNADLPSSNPCSEKNACLIKGRQEIIVTSSENQTFGSETGKSKDNDDHVVPELSQQNLETSQELKSPNAKQFPLTTRKQKRDDDEDPELTNGGHLSKKIRIKASEEIDADTDCHLVEDDKPNDGDDLPKSSVSFVDLTADSPSPVAPEECLDKIGQQTTPYLFKCNLSLRRNNTYILLELAWLEGENRELMQQLLQYFHNTLNARNK